MRTENKKARKATRNRRLIRRWRQESFSSGRLVDLGPSPGPTALDLQKIRRQSEVFRSVRRFFISVCVGAVLLLAMALALREIDSLQAIWRQVVGKLLSDPVGVFSVVATTGLTLALLVVTRRYVDLTSEMLREIREQRVSEIEPQLAVYTVPTLARVTERNSHVDWETEVVVRNIGRSPAFDVRFVEDWFAADRYSSSTSVQITEEPLTIAPAEEERFYLGVNQKSIEEWPAIEAAGRPSFSVRIRYHDSFFRPYSITQDYGFVGAEGTPQCVLQCEFSSSPSNYRWREGQDTLGIETGQRGVSMVITVPDE
jgi:hypothetical protein